MTICGKINLVISVAVILLATVWFVLVVVISERPRDPRISKLGLMGLPLPMERQQWMHLHHVELPELKKTNFELIQIMNNESPNILGDQVLLLISLGETPSQPLYSHFIQLLHKRTKNNEYLSPIYVLRQFAPLNLNNEKNIHLYANEIKDALKYFLRILNIKKLSILSFEQGALLTLFTLSIFKDIYLFPRIDKLILINPFNPYISVYHSSIHSLSRQIKRNIVQDSLRLQAFDRLRIIILTTTHTVYPKQMASIKHFYFLFQSTNSRWYQLKGTAVISSRAMWRVYSLLHSNEYFIFDPFISLLARFLIQDKKVRFNTAQIFNFFYYLETFPTRYASQRMKRKHMGKCIQYSLGQKYREGDKTGKLSFTRVFQYQRPCLKLIPGQAKDLIIYSEKHFQIYGENYQKLIPMDNITHTLYHLEGLNKVNCVYIINVHNSPIYFSRGYAYAGYSNPMTNEEQDVVRFELDQNQQYHPIKLCDSATLIYPIHFRRNSQRLMFKNWRECDCYAQFDSFEYYPDWFLYNWNLIRNIMIFSVFCSHVLSKTNFQRFCTQAFANLLILAFALGQILVFQNLILLSTVTVIELCIKYAIKLSAWINFSGTYSKLALLLPLLFDLAYQYKIYDGNIPSAWKVLTFQLWFLSSQSSILIVIIKLYFMVGPLYNRQGCEYGLVLLCIWQYIALQDQPPKESSQLKRKIADIIFLFAMVFCIQEDGSVVHEIINFYIITHVLLSVNEKINAYFA